MSRTSDLTIQQQVDLQSHNTLGVPAIAECYCRVSTLAELQQAREAASQRGLPLLILGGGSNQIMAPKIPGLVCHIQLRGIEFKSLDQGVRVRAAAGENWHQFVRYTLGQGWSGLEALSLIPGQVGAAPIQNIGAYGTELADRVHCVEVIDRQSGEQQTLSASQCEFGYRDSYLKRSAAFVVTAVHFNLDRQPGAGSAMGSQYPDVAAELAKLGWHNPTPRQIAEAVVRVRRRKLPDIAQHGNLGSVFQNPVVDAGQLDRLALLIPDLVRYPTSKTGHYKLAAAQLIDAAGWKGRSSKGFSVWARQPLVIVRSQEGEGDGEGMYQLTAAIAADVAERYGVALTLEPQLLGFAEA